MTRGEVPRGCGLSEPERGPSRPTATFVFTDIEGSTHLLQQLGDAYGDVLSRTDEVLGREMQRAGGRVLGREGDALFVAFDDAARAIAGALAGQRALLQERWSDGVEVRVRMGLHSGEVTTAPNGQLIGLALHQTSRICAAAHGGQIVLSDAARLLAGDDLPHEAGFLPLGHHRLKDLPEPVELYQLAHPDLPREFPRLRSDAAPGNLPKQVTSFVGRRVQVGEATSRITGGAALVTLTGPGGAGKTRLALEVAAEVVDRFPDGAWLVELASSSDGGQVAPAVASALDVRDEPGLSVPDVLVRALRTKRLLLILDNCEHVVGEVARLTAALLRACAGVQVLATSQEALALPGEHVLVVPPLAVEDAVRLFAERAALHRPGFVLDEPNGAAVRKICRRLDGIPLAIELAAARIAVLSPAQIAGRLDDQFRLLTGGSRAALPRQRTLRATVDWSHALLADDERVLFRRLAVFARGFRLEAAEAVCSDDSVAEGAVLDLLARLVARSLVAVEEQDMEARYRLLEPIRQYAREKLLEAGEAAAVGCRHRDVYLDLARAAEPELTGPDQAQWLRRLALEYGNLRAAMEWSAANGAGGAALVELAAALWLFWLVRGHWSEGRGWLERALDGGAHGVPPALRARALAAAGELAAEQGDAASAQPLLERSLEIARGLDDRAAVARALDHLGNLARSRFEFDAARALLGDSLAIRRDIGDRRETAVTLCDLGLLASSQRDYETARAYYEEALPIARAAGDKRVVANLTAGLAVVTFTDGDHAGAQRLGEEGLEIARDLGDRRGIAEHLTVLAGIAAAEGDTAASQALAEEALAVRATLGARDATAASYTTLGELAYAAGDLAGARDQLEAALTAWRRVGDDAGITRVALLAGNCAVLLGRLDEAEALLQEAEELARRVDDLSARSSALHGLGDVARHRGDLAYAQRLYDQSIDVARDAGWKRLLWGPVQGLAVLARLRGENDLALDLLRQSIALRPKLGRRLGTAGCLDEAAAVLTEIGDDEVAVQLLAAATRLREESRAEVPPVRRADLEELVDRLRGRLGDEAFQAAWKRGTSWSPEEAVAAVDDAGR